MAEQALVAILKGGLGNQLFIYAAAKAAACRSQRHLYLDTKIGYAADAFGRDYALGRFGVKEHEAPESLRLASGLSHWRHKLRRAWNKGLPEGWKTYLADRGGDELLRLRSRAPTVYVVGYWQSERFFTDQTELIRECLRLPKPDSTELLNAGRVLLESNAVALHLRRDRFPMIVDLDYYQAAIDALHAADPCLPFVLFGDSTELAMEHLDFRGHPVERSPGSNEWDPLVDFWLMSQCRHAILSNSSFAWWAAWFGDALHEARRVYAPCDYGWRMEPSAQWTSLPNRILANE